MRFYGTGKKKGILILSICSLFLKSLLHRSGMPDQPTSGSAVLHFNELICKLILMSSFKFLCWRLTSAGTVLSLLLFYNTRLLTVQLVSCSLGIYLQSDISNSVKSLGGCTCFSTSMQYISSSLSKMASAAAWPATISNKSLVWHPWAQNFTHCASGICGLCLRFEERDSLH